MRPQTRHSWTRVRPDPGETVLHYVLSWLFAAVAIVCAVLAMSAALSWHLPVALVCIVVGGAAVLAAIFDPIPGGGRQ